MVDLITQGISQLDMQPLTLVASALDLFTYPILALIWLAMYRAGRKKAALKALALGAIVTLVVVFSLKAVVASPRPCDALPAKIDCPEDNSFPSGHAAFTALLIPALFGSPLLPAYLAFHIFVSFTRMYLGVHVLQDIAGGTVIGMAIYLLSAKFLGAFDGNKK
jgi:membrane-associated phospholipid phosphatase